MMERAGTQILDLRQRFLKTGRIGMGVKDDRSPVTEADQAAHQVLDGALPRLLDVPVVSEEGSMREAPASGFWLVDPLDGTKEFLKGRDEWTVNVALVVDGRAIAGMVSAPVLGLFWWGIPGQGAWRQEDDAWVPIRSAPLAGDVCRVVASTSHRGADVDGFVAALQADGKAVEELSYGSSLKICRVAEGSADVYPRLGPTMHWDTAAADAVIHGAGGKLTDLDGHPLRYGSEPWRNPHFIAGAPGVDWTRYAAASSNASS